MNLTNLFAFSIPISLFSFWMIIGYAALSLLRTQRNLLQNVLLAPTVGFAFTALLVFWLNRAGLPVREFSLYLNIALLSVSGIALLWKKPIFPWQRYLIFISIFLIALLLTGYPLLKFGFNWISYGNDDMANYCLGATRFLYHGFSEEPNLKNLINHSDYSSIYWFFSNVRMVRMGSELLLAWTSAVFQRLPVEVFMPLILSLLLTQISVTAALIYQSKLYRQATVLTILLLAFSGLMSLGALYQLIAQVGGISLLIGLGCLMLQPFTLHQKHNTLRQSILISCLLSSLLIFYPETSPFLVLAMIFYFSIFIFNGGKLKKTFWLIAISTTCISIVLLNTYFINIYTFLKMQIAFSKHAPGLNTFSFPFFLLPSGLSNLWGFQVIAKPNPEPLQSILILLSLLLIAFLLLLALKEIRKSTPVVIFMLVMFFMGGYLFIQQNGFGLFKLAMYIQPFLLASLVIVVLNKLKSNYYKLAYFGAFSILTLYAQHIYVNFSEGRVGSLFVEIPNGSQTHFIDEIKQLNLSQDISKPIIFDTNSIVYAKLISQILKGHSVEFYSNDFFRNLITYDKHPLLQKYFPTLLAHADYIQRIYNEDRINRNFSKASFQASAAPFTKNSTLILSSPLRSIFNRRKFSGDYAKNYMILPWEKAQNYLLFINSTLSQNFYFGKKPYISTYNFIEDYFNKSNTYIPIGRYFLFQVINPSPRFRLELSMTDTLNGDGINTLPPASVIGTEKKRLPLIGRGSARVFSPPITPVFIKNVPYIMLDMGIFGKPMPISRQGIANIYGKNISIDTRLMTGYGRDISLISEQEYKSLIPPFELKNFPLDLDNPDLEYAGIYEDGCISENAFFTLRQPFKRGKLIIEGVLPPFKNFSQKITIALNKKELFSQEITDNHFYIALTNSLPKGIYKITLHFSKIASTLKDKRPVAAKIQFLGFKDSTLTSNSHGDA